MIRKFLSLPFSAELAQEDAWDRLDDSRTTFFVVRFHFYLESRQVAEPHKVGDKLAVFDFPKGASQEHVTTSEFEREDINLVSSIENYLLESDIIAKHVHELAATVKLAGITEVRGKIQNEFTAQLKESFSITSQVDETSKVRSKIQFQVKNTLGPTITKPVIAVPVFQRHAVDIQLAWLDYLVVKFERRLFGLRKKKTSYPVVTNPRCHPNRVRCRVPLTTMYFWEHLWRSCKLLYEDNYVTEVDDPDEILVSPYANDWVRNVSFPKVPTLYQIARVAFPHKWVKRNGPWTEQELMQIELEEARGTAWWHRHGHGSIV